jgi:FixJ family two-component response regulator
MASFAALTAFAGVTQTMLKLCREPPRAARICLCKAWKSVVQVQARRLVLVVEDELIVREDALDLLRRGGFDARGFSSAKETLAYLRDHADETAAIFTDVWMDTATEGLDLARVIHATWPWIALLVTSGGTARPPTGLPMKAHYISKPWRPEQVLRFIQKNVAPGRTPEAA